jgi:glycosyltransferase involved in cell wall biosynthesis
MAVHLRGKKIGVDARLATYRRGMGTFIYYLISTFARLGESCQFILYTTNTSAPELQRLPANFSIRSINWPSYPLWEQIGLPIAARSDDVDLLHCPANTAPIFTPSRVKLVLTIHDVIYLLPSSSLPVPLSVYQRLGRLYRRFIVPIVARRADAIITVSYRSRSDILRFLDVSPERIYVVYEAPGNLFCKLPDSREVDRVRKRYGISGPFILALGGVDPRKNTARILESFSKLKARLHSSYQLVIVGLPVSARRRFGHIVGRMGICSDTILVEFVPEEDLVALYNGAELFVYPSLYEGFGLPVLEAMASGTPVVASTEGAIPEIAGEAAVLVDPRNADALAEAMEMVLTDAQLREELVERGFERVKEFSWQKAAREVLDIYRKVLDT